MTIRQALLFIALLNCLQFLSHGVLASGDPPVGHLQKLGSHRPREGLVAELREVPHPIDFNKEYANPGVPVVFKGAAKTMPAFRLWTDEYLKATAGDESVAVEPGKKENRTRVAMEGGQQSFTLSEFLQEYNTSDIYMVDAIPEPLKADFHLPRCLLCGGFTSYLRESIVWFSSGGTKSVLHKDPLDNINCLLNGKKQFFLADKKYVKTLPLSQAGHVELDVDAVNLLKMPQLTEVRWWQANVEEGDCLFIPEAWLHQVRSSGRNLAVNIWWNHLHRFNSTDCFADDEKQLKPLPAGAPFDQFEIGPGSAHRAALLSQLFASKEQRLYLMDVYLHLKAMDRNSRHDERLTKQQMKNIAKGVFSDIDTDRDWRLSESELYAAPAEMLEEAFGEIVGGYSIEQLKVENSDEEEEEEIGFDDEVDEDLMAERNHHHNHKEHQEFTHAEL